MGSVPSGWALIILAPLCFMAGQYGAPPQAGHYGGAPGVAQYGAPPQGAAGQYGAPPMQGGPSSNAGTVTGVLQNKLRQMIQVRVRQRLQQA